jgi:hypothetical protein
MKSFRAFLSEKRKKKLKRKLPDTMSGEGKAQEGDWNFVDYTQRAAPSADTLSSSQTDLNGYRS